MPFLASNGWTGARRQYALERDETNTDRETEAIRAFNHFIHTDERVEMVMLPIGDGLTVALKRS
jgi:predicted O-methyltransferase YrrM